jgi:MFS family permease
MLVAGIAFASGSILQAAAENIEMLLIGRVLLGAGVAFASVSVPLYNSEMVRLWTHGYADDCRASQMEVTAAATLLNRHCTSFNVRESTIDLLP